VQAGTLGEVLVVEADHGQLLWPDGPARLSQPELAGGALLDLGVYPVSFADHVLGRLVDVHALGTLTDLGVDATTTVEARGAGGAIAHLWCSMAAASSCPARVVGTAGRIELEGRFYNAGSRVRLVAPGGEVLDEFVPRVSTHGFRFEAAEVARALAEHRLETWSMPWDATRRVLTVLDEVRRQVGVVYPGEEGAA
jgi:predicted dehydrogenase